MPVDFADLHAKMSRVIGGADLVQIDVMDGKFTPGKTWPYIKEDQNFQRILDEKQGMPYWNELDFEADLMVLEGEKKAHDWIKAGAKRIILHIEGLADPKATLADLHKEYGAYKDSFFSPEIGLALNPDTPNFAIEPFLDGIDFVQVMGIGKIGYQGQPFDSRAIDKIKALRKARPETIISVDGGVSAETLPSLVQAGASRLVSGSAVFENPNALSALRELRKLAQ